MTAYKSENLLDGAINSDIIDQILSSGSKLKDSGAHNLFLGQVRNDIIDGKEVLGIIYSAYDEMVDREIQIITDQVKNEFSDIKKVVIRHSKGMVKSGENSLLVYIASGHRKQAFEASRLTVELIKEKLPVWKKEVFNDGSYHWPSNE